MLGGCVPCPRTLNITAQPQGEYCVCRKVPGYEACRGEVKGAKPSMSECMAIVYSCLSTLKCWVC